jgi:hypothetical protein
VTLPPVGPCAGAGPSDDWGCLDDQNSGAIGTCRNQACCSGCFDPKLSTCVPSYYLTVTACGTEGDICIKCGAGEICSPWGECEIP